MGNAPFLCQVALVALDGKRMRRWYEESFGLVPAGQTIFAGPWTTRVQGIPRVANLCRWLVDSQDLFQLEIFQYWSPKSKWRRPDWRPCDIGYSRIGLHVADYERTLENLVRMGAQPLSEPVGRPGSRRFCVRDPEGNCVEVMEDDPLEGLAPARVRPEVPVTVRSVSVSVPDLEAGRATWAGTFGLPEARGIELHGPEHEALWGLQGAERRTLVLHAGGLLVELVQYADPKGRAWPEGYRICDQGIMNVAFGFRDARAFNEQFQRAVVGGCRPNGVPLDIGVFRVMYVNDPARFSIELLYPRPWAFGLTGFKPSIPYVAAEEWIPAPPDRVWPRITDHESMRDWLPLRVRLSRDGAGERNGQGAVRILEKWGMRFEEEIVSWVPPRAYGYRLTRGAPLSNHRGDVILFAENGGTRVRWSIRFKSLIPGLGAIAGWVLGRALRTGLRKLKAEIEKGG